MIVFDLDKYREVFKEESDTLLAEIDTLLLDVEKKGSIEDEQIQNLFRNIHTVKGGAASVELVLTSKFAHEFESFLDKVRNKKFSFKSEMSDIFIACNDLIKEFIDVEIAGELQKKDYELRAKPLLDAFGDIQSGKESMPKIEPTKKSFGFFDENLESPFLQEEPKFHAPQAKEEKKPNYGFFFDITEKVEEKTGESQSEEDRAEGQKQGSKAGVTIRVDLSKVDTLMNNIGELVIDMSMLYQYTENIADQNIKNELLERMAIFERHIRDLQESVMSTRMVPMENIYAKFPKSIRDISKKLNKEIEFKSFGSSVEIDKAMIEGLNDPLMHIVRNSCDHGIEYPDERQKASKAPHGTITMSAEQANGQIVITVSDDGKGIDSDLVAQKAIENGMLSKERYAVMSDQEKLELIFEPGLSTAKNVTEVSGRGVGMDVVKNNISKLGGNVRISSQKGRGTSFVISLPLTLAILDGLNITVGESKFILPLASIVESLQPDSSMIKIIGDGSEELLMLRDEAIPIIRLHKVFNIEPMHKSLTDGMLIISRSVYGKVALFLDMFLNQQQIVIKPIDKNFRAIKGVSGATVRGDGTIGLILDVMGIIELHREGRRVA